MTEKEDFEAHFDKRNSLSYWYPKLLDLGLPVPRTRIISLIENIKMIRLWVYGEGKLSPDFATALKEEAREFGYPLFMRTDQASNKFEYKDACVVNSPEDLLSHFGRTIEFNEEVDVPYREIIFRELLKPEFSFTAYKAMPVTRERRYFARDGKYECHHPYWFPKVITERMSSHQPSPPPNWRGLLRDTNRETEEEVILLSGYAEKITKELGDYWSVDFLYANNQWWITDMALGKASYHHPYHEHEDKQ